jgi:hypothetical protein
MKDTREELKVSQQRISLSDFLETYNKNMPKSFPRASSALLEKFRDEHLTLFKTDNLWSLDIHRKKLIDWLPRNGGIIS